MDWKQVDIFTTTAGIEPVGAALLELNTGGYEVRDAADFNAFLEGKTGRWDYIDESLMKLRESETTLTIYLTEDEQGAERLALLREALERLKTADIHGEWGRLEYSLTGVREEDWATAWKRYYHPSRIGERLVVCPSWEEYAPAEGEVVVHLDPGMAFGTGGHDSTRLCVRLLEECGKQNARVLDLGCGSGILSVAALLLGAESAVGIDIDEVAVRVAGENAALNGVAERCRFLRGSLDDRMIAEIGGGAFDVIFANIVADVILEFLPDVRRLLKPDGVFITSGIIDTREQDILAALPQQGLRVEKRLESGGWIGLRCEKVL